MVRSYHPLAVGEADDATLAPVNHMANRRSRDRLIWCGLGIPLLVFGLLLFAAARHAATSLDRAMVAAVQRSDLESVRRLLARGANPNAHLAYQNRVTSAADAVDWLIHSDRVFWYDAPVLIEAAAHRKNEVAIIQALLAAGADVNGRDHYGRTALMESAVGGRAGAVEFLLEHGADSTLQDEGGCTALDRAHDGVTRACLSTGRVTRQPGIR